MFQQQTLMGLTIMKMEKTHTDCEAINLFDCILKPMLKRLRIGYTKFATAVRV